MERKSENAETYVAENFLGYRILRSAYVAEYETSPPFRMFIIETDSSAESEKMAGAYLQAVMHPGKLVKGSVLAVRDPHHGELLIVVEGRYFFGVVGGGETPLAERHLRQLEASLLERGD